MVSMFCGAVLTTAVCAPKMCTAIPSPSPGSRGTIRPQASGGICGCRRSPWAYATVMS
ncbi:hypothetical protein BD626DRAFT_517571 [Schizophyllum amplum]|uniref:Uncharacterized protein n=1 Tax=Schizophyllum amplum TaxID=97359 RepID=A0A550BWA1_9AGAR|nr:hypothetical protein BD626DRAFT_517571 [Auriculariopsis ampla]